MADRQVDLKLNIKATDTKQVQSAFASMSKDSKEIAAGTRAWQDALKSVGGDLDAQQAKLTKLKASMTPENARRKSGLLNQEDKLLGREAPEVLPGNAKAKAAMAKVPGGKGGAPGGGGGIMDLFGGKLGGITKALGPLGAAAGIAIGAFKTMQGIFNSIVGFVSKANPGAVKRLNMVFDDMTAVVGHTLTPIVEIATKGFRNIADFLASILPSSDEFREALKPISEYFDATRDVLAEIAPILKEFISDGLKALGVALKAIYGPITKFIGLLKQMGFIKGGSLKSSVGAAAHQHNFQDSDAYAKSIYTAIASGQGKEPQKETAENTAGMLAEFPKLRAAMEAVGKAITSLGGRLNGAFDSLKGVFGTLGETLSLGFAEFGKFTGSIGEELGKLPDKISDFAGRIPDAIRDGLADLPDTIARAIKGVLPFGGSDPGQGPLGEGARRARQGWVNP